jgi:uncharacterized membrane protein
VILLVLSLILNIVPIVIYFINYSNLPDSIPVSVNLLGTPLSYMPKSYFAIMRLPLMGILLNGLCFTMYLEKVTEEAKKITRIIWPVAALICSFKTGLTSLEILLEQEQTISNFRIAVFALILIGIAVLAYGAYKLVKTKVSILGKDEMDKKKMYVIAVILFVYAIIIFLPRFL